jgi:hypothetical protein
MKPYLRKVLINNLLKPFWDYAARIQTWTFTELLALLGPRIFSTCLGSLFQGVLPEVTVLPWHGGAGPLP